MERWPSCQFWNVLLSGKVLQTLFSVILKPSNWSGTDQQQRKYGFHYSSPIVVLNCGVKVSSESQRGIIWCARDQELAVQPELQSDNLRPGEDIQTVTTVITVITISWYISHPHYHVTTAGTRIGHSASVILGSMWHHILAGDFYPSLPSRSSNCY